MPLIKGRDIALRGVIINNDSTIARMSNAECTNNNEFPVVYRGIETAFPGVSTTGNYRYPTFDRVAWEGRIMNYDRRYKRIFYRPLNFTDTLTALNPVRGISSWSTNWHSGIYARAFGLTQADIAQGSLLSLWVPANLHDTAMVLSFARASMPYTDTATQSSNLWHVPLSIGSFNNKDSAFDNNTISNVRGIQLKDIGKLAHLAARPILTNRNQYKQTRRIFEKGSSTSQIISQTAQHFYRQSINSDEEAVFLSVIIACVLPG